MFITPAFAATAAATPDAAATALGASGILTSMMPILLIFAVFYMLVLRPQNKRVIEHRKTINELQPGDKVVTGGGLIATVKSVVNNDEVILEIADGVKVRAVRSTILAKR